MEAFWEDDKRKYIVTKVLRGFADLTFKRGAEVVYWNGMPIARAVWNFAQRYSGSNLEARHAMGLWSFTLRAMQFDPPPDEEWVVVGYRTPEGAVLEKRCPWSVGANPWQDASLSWSVTATASEQSVTGMPPEQNDKVVILRRAKTALFAAAAIGSEITAIENETVATDFEEIPTRLEAVFQAGAYTKSGTVLAYIRIFQFREASDDEIVAEFVRLLALVPPDGLIIDIRGNPGGWISAAERMLQTLTPERIEPEHFQFINTPLNLALCRNAPLAENLRPWIDPIAEGLKTGDVYSAALPKTDVGQCNSIGQKYFSPVVLISDALTYSAADMFAAGFQDHNIGQVLGTDWRTGAGGSNVWRYTTQFRSLGPPYGELPQGTEFKISVRRSLRVGSNAGSVLEDFGVKAHVRHATTRADVLNGDVDLINTAAALLAQLGPARALAVSMNRQSPSRVALIVTAKAMTWLDVYIDDRPQHSVPIKKGRVKVVVAADAARKSSLEIRAFDANRLVARYRENITV